MAGPDLTPQIRQLQDSVDAMAIELERISEGQRFTAKLLAERSGGWRRSSSRARTAWPVPGDGVARCRVRPCVAGPVRRARAVSEAILAGGEQRLET